MNAVDMTAFSDEGGAHYLERVRVAWRARASMVQAERARFDDALKLLQAKACVADTGRR